MAFFSSSGFLCVHSFQIFFFRFYFAFSAIQREEENEKNDKDRERQSEKFFHFLEFSCEKLLASEFDVNLEAAHSPLFHRKNVGLSFLGAPCLYHAA